MANNHSSTVEYCMLITPLYAWNVTLIVYLLHRRWFGENSTCVESRPTRTVSANEVNSVITDGTRFAEHKNIKCRNFVFVCTAVLSFEI